MCVCTCFTIPGGNLNLNTHRLMGTRVIVGTQIEVPIGTQAYKSVKSSTILTK